MSGFRENLGRGEKEELDYDDSAFYYFGLAMLVITLTPTTYFALIKPMFYGAYKVNYSIKNCRCDACAQKIA